MRTNINVFINYIHGTHIKIHLSNNKLNLYNPLDYSPDSVFIYFNFLSIRILHYHKVKTLDTVNLYTSGYLYLHMVSVKTKAYVTTLTPQPAVRNPLLNWDYQFAADNSVERNDGH